ncbi:MAG: ABC transporter permease [Clostridia bacterium]|nr:ABC transporter permease [Clostridia bacterium]
MIKYVIKRILLIIPTMLVVLFVIFTILALSPGDPGRLILGQAASQEQVDKLNHEFGVDQPFFVRFFNYMKGLVQGDFGTSYRTRNPVLEDIGKRLPYTIRLALLSMAVGAVIGIAFGIISAVRQYSIMDGVCTSLAMILAAMPGFFFGMFAIYIFSLKLGWLPSSGVQNWKGWIMPVITNSIGMAAGLLRLTRASMLETIRSDYIRTARAKGASESTVIWKHALRNGLLPVVTTLGMRLGGIMGGSVITERVFNFPGVGNYTVTSTQAKDMPTVLSSTLILSTFFCLIMLLVDISYGFIDPRIKARYTT